MSDREPVPLDPSLGADSVTPGRVPAIKDGMLSVSGMHELFEGLDRRSSVEAWLTGTRIQYVRDKHLRDVDWWFRKVWKPNGCHVSLTLIKKTSAQEEWPRQRADLWDRVFYVIEERFAEEEAEHALTLVKKLKGVQAVILDKLSPRVIRVTDADGTVREELELKVQPKSYEGLARALKDIIEMSALTQRTALELIAGSRGTEDLAVMDVLPEQNKANESTALGRLKTQGTLRQVANLLALQDGKRELDE